MIDQITFDAFDSYLKGVAADKTALAALYQIQHILFEDIKKTDWKDLVVVVKPDHGNLRCYQVTLSDDLTSRFNALQKAYEKLLHLGVVGEDHLFQGETYETYCELQICMFNGRINIINDGIAVSLRKLGLGCKIYRAILAQEDYLTSEEHGLSGYGKLVWNSMKKNNLFYTFYTSVHAFAFASDKDPSEILGILESKISIDYFKTMLWDQDFVKQHENLIRQSTLAPLCPL